MAGESNGKKNWKLYGNLEPIVEVISQLKTSQSAQDDNYLVVYYSLNPKHGILDPKLKTPNQGFGCF